MLHAFKGWKEAPRHLLTLLLALALCFALILGSTLSANATTVYEISDDTSTVTIESDADDIDEVLAEAGITLQDADQLEVDRDGSTVQLNITRAQFASVSCDGAVSTARISADETVASLLAKLNITSDEDDLLSAGLDETVSSGDVITLQRVTITYSTQEEAVPYTGTAPEGMDLTGKTIRTYQSYSVDGGEPTVTLTQTETITYYTTEETIPSDGSASDGKTIYVYEQDVVDDGEPASTLINTITVTYYTEEESIPYESREVESSSLYVGDSEITQEGVNGKTVRTYEVRTVDDGEPVVTLVSTETTDPVDEITSIGTKEYATSAPSYAGSGSTGSATFSGGTVTVDGVTYNVKYSCSGQATAYSSDSGALTASGKPAQVGIIAVDPSVFPLGTKMLIVTNDGAYTYLAVAGDTGGAIKGHIVDLYFNTVSECYTFGRRNCTIYVLE